MVTTDNVQFYQRLLGVACLALAHVVVRQRASIANALALLPLGMLLIAHGLALPDDIETMFQPFHSSKKGGLGMGLSICRTLVTSHGGRLWAERRAERGAAFYVALPLAKEGA